MTIIRRTTPVALLILAASLALTLTAGCASTTTAPRASAPATHSAAPAAATSSTTPAAAPSPPPSPSEVLCLTHSCIVDDADQIVGSAASDGSVIAKMSCQASTVRHAAPGVFAADCTATYSDGSRWYGIATVQPSKDQVSWEPKYQE